MAYTEIVITRFGDHLVSMLLKDGHPVEFQCVSEKNKVDIYDIPIVEITNQYMEYIRQMQREDLNVMSEFLVMAATLLDIKCKMLLPKEVKEDGEEEDPRQELVEQLLQYKMYKYMSYELRDRQVDCGSDFI